MPLITTEAQLAEFSLAPGFRASSTACGLKKSGSRDLLMLWADEPCAAAGVFTTNRVQAAPVLVDRDALASAAGRIRGVVANSGCANAVTGERGMTDAMRMQAVAAAAVQAKPEEMLVLSTGVIGVFLDMDKLKRGIATLHGGGTAASSTHADAARAICTTDTRAKVASATVALSGGRVTIAGFAKGAGMIHPNMATMLGVITTDAAISPEALDRALRAAVSESFNRISVDGDMSTNDTVLVLASGLVGCVAADEAAFTAALAAVCKDLARQIARDGEGATRLVELRITGAASEPQAHRVGDSIACSPLVKTAIHGNDPNWGRILAAAGYSGAEIDPARVRLWFGDADDVQLLDRGLPVAFDAARASALLQNDPCVIHLDLGLGEASATVWTCDFSAEYVRINADYTT